MLIRQEVVLHVSYNGAHRALSSSATVHKLPAIRATVHPSLVASKSAAVHILQTSLSIPPVCLGCQHAAPLTAAAVQLEQQILQACPAGIAWQCSHSQILRGDAQEQHLLW
jgi:hypothetical protein